MSRLVKKIHFPSEGFVPSPPDKRKVDAGSAAAKSEYLRFIAVPAESELENLVAFGQALHPLQDSWSHQGIPDSPFAWVCDRTLSWGHPVARGGWFSHKADLTHLYVNDTMEMADASYTAMCLYREKLQGASCKQTFLDISAEVIQLAQSSTKLAKANWFNEFGINNVGFLSATNVANGDIKGLDGPVDYGSAALKAMRKSNLLALPDTPEASFMANFLHLWMTSQDVSGLVREMIALGAYRAPLGLGEPLSIEPIAAEAQLKFWRVRDHGSLQERLEGNHDLIAIGLSTIPELIKQDDKPYTSLDGALLPFDASGIPIITWTTKRPDGAVLWVGAVRFRHAPQDIVFVVAESIDGQPKVVSINSVIIR